MCNLQGREIALRISEEVSDALAAGDRDRIARIAEEVCMSFTAEAAPASSALTVIERPSQDNDASSTQAASVSASVEEEIADEDDGVLGGLRIIPAEDRVRRPGLKRP